MQWICEKCGAMNSHEISVFNRMQPRKPVVCRKCGTPHPDGYYTTEE